MQEVGRGTLPRGEGRYEFRECWAEREKRELVPTGGRVRVALARAALGMPLFSAEASGARVELRQTIGNLEDALTFIIPRAWAARIKEFFKTT